MSAESDNLLDEHRGLQWYCLRSRPKHEHIAAATLRESGFAVLNPMVRVPRKRREKVIWVSEAMFPCYLFVKSTYREALDRVQFTVGVKGFVQFGDGIPTIPDESIESLRAAMGEGETVTLNNSLRTGEEVVIDSGPFSGFSAIVQIYLPASHRVRVLLDFLGQRILADVSGDFVMGRRNYPASLLISQVG